MRPWEIWWVGAFACAVLGLIGLIAEVISLALADIFAWLIALFSDRTAETWYGVFVTVMVALIPFLIGKSLPAISRFYADSATIAAVNRGSRNKVV